MPACTSHQPSAGPSLQGLPGWLNPADTLPATANVSSYNALHPQHACGCCSCHGSSSSHLARDLHCTLLPAAWRAQLCALLLRCEPRLHPRELPKQERAPARSRGRHTPAVHCSSSSSLGLALAPRRRGRCVSGHSCCCCWRRSCRCCCCTGACTRTVVGPHGSRLLLSRSWCLLLLLR